MGGGVGCEGLKPFEGIILREMAHSSFNSSSKPGYSFELAVSIHISLMIVCDHTTGSIPGFDFTHDNIQTTKPQLKNLVNSTISSGG